MKLIFTLLLLLTLTVRGGVISALPSTNSAAANDLIVLNATNVGAGTFTTKTITTGNYLATRPSVTWITTTTNIGGIASTGGGTPANSALTFTLQGTTTAPVTYLVKGHLQCVTSNGVTAGITCYLDLMGTDICSGWFARSSGQPNDVLTVNAYARTPFSGHVAQVYISNTSGALSMAGDFEFMATTRQTNAYAFQLYQNTAVDAANIPFLTTNCWIRLERITP